MNTKEVLAGKKQGIPEEVLAQLGCQIKTEQDLSAVIKQLTKQLVERSLKAELSHHLEEEREDGKANSRNGYSAKTLKGDFGQMPIEVPRDRTGRFDPILIRKGQTNRSSIRPCTWRWGLIWRVKRSYWASGSPKRKGRNSGYRF